MPVLTGQMARLLKKTCKFMASLYLAAFIGTNIHIVHDSANNNLPRIEDSKRVFLKTERYKIKIGERNEDLTLVGEIHYYNKAEQEIGRRLVSEHEHIAYEGDGTEGIGDISKSKLIYMRTFMAVSDISASYYRLGSGRFYDDILLTAVKMGRDVHGLEFPYDPFRHMSIPKRAMFLGQMFLSNLTSPAYYYAGKNEEALFKSDNLGSMKPYKTEILDKRNKDMAMNIIKLLEGEDIDNLLAVVGQAHLEGIVDELAKETCIEKVE